KSDAPARDRANRRPGGRLDEHAGPGRAARTRLAVFAREPPRHGPGELALEPAERLGGDRRPSLEPALQLGHERLQLLLLRAQALEPLAVARHARVDLGERR